MSFDMTQALALVRARSNSMSSAEQNERWAKDYLDWCRASGQRYPEDDGPKAHLAYQTALAARGKLNSPKSWAQRKSAINKLALATAELVVRNGRAASARFRTHLVDTLPPGSTADRAAQALIASGKDETRRRVLRCELATFLAYCAELQIDPASVGTADLRLYRRHLVARPSASVNQLMTTAGRFLRELKVLEHAQ